MMLVRALTATVLFVMLSQVNAWVDTKTHLVLAVGYRAFMLSVPFFMFLGATNAMRISIGLCLVSLLTGLISINYINIGIFALGMAVSGYIAKSVAAHTSLGAADNKVSLNIGSLFSGVILICMTNRSWTLVTIAALTAIALFFSFNVDWNSMETNAKEESKHGIDKQQLSALPLLGWLLMGIATGIKLTGIFTVLPQYLIAKTGVLPNWFGVLIILNSLVIILMQHKVLKFLDTSKESMTLVFSMSAMLILAIPALIHVESIIMAVLWIGLLTIGECALSRYDRIAKEDGYLFPKELMVGIGSFLTVLLSRNFNNQIHLSGILGCLCLGAGALLITRITSTQAQPEGSLIAFAPNGPSNAEYHGNYSGDL